VCAAEEAEVLIEAALQGMVRRTIPEVPFSHEPRDVPRRLHPIGEGRLRQRQPELEARVQAARVELVAEALLVPARDEACAGRAADRAGDIAVREAHALPGHGVEVGSGDFLAAVASELAVAQVVPEDHDDVRAPLGKLRRILPRWKDARLHHISARPQCTLTVSRP